MMTFRDDQKLINISMQTIYFMLSEEQRTQHKEMVEMFNSLKAFTLGLYEFKILTKLGSVNSSLSDDIKAEIEANNLIVRLPNDTDGNFIYVFNNIDLSEDRDIVEEHLHNFVVELAKQSIACRNCHLLEAVCNYTHTYTATCKGRNFFIGHICPLRFICSILYLPHPFLLLLP